MTRQHAYANFICDLRPLKDDTHRVRCTVGGNLLDYVDYPSSPAASLLDIKIHINSTISDAHQGARYATADIENFYLNNPMSTYRYMRIALKDIPDEIITEYNHTIFPTITTSTLKYVKVCMASKKPALLLFKD